MNNVLWCIEPGTKPSTNSALCATSEPKTQERTLQDDKPELLALEAKLLGDPRILNLQAKARAQGIPVVAISNQFSTRGNEYERPERIIKTAPDALIAYRSLEHAHTQLTALPLDALRRPVPNTEGKQKLIILSGPMGCGKSTVQQLIRAHGVYVLRAYKSRDRGHEEPDVQIGASRTNISPETFRNERDAKERGKNFTIDYIAELTVPGTNRIEYYGRERVENQSYVAHLGLFALAQTGEALISENEATHEAHAYIMRIPEAFRESLIRDRFHSDDAVLQLHRETHERRLYEPLLYALSRWAKTTRVHALEPGEGKVNPYNSKHTDEYIRYTENRAGVTRSNTISPIRISELSHLPVETQYSISFANQCAALARTILLQTAL
jgi:hypothetical protein